MYSIASFSPKKEDPPICFPPKKGTPPIFFYKKTRELKPPDLTLTYLTPTTGSRIKCIKILMAKNFPASIQKQPKNLL